MITSKETINNLIQQAIDRTNSSIERSYNQQDSQMGSCPHQPDCSHCGDIADKAGHYRDQQTEVLDQLTIAKQEFEEYVAVSKKDVGRMLELLDLMTSSPMNLTDNGGRIVNEDSLLEIETILEQT